MSDNTANIRAVITAKDNASATLAGFSNNAAKMGAALESTGRTLTKNLTVPILGAIGYSAKLATSFQQQMTYVRTQAGDTEDNLNKMSQAVLNLARVSQYGPEELAKGLFHLASLGLRGAEAMKALDTAQRLAAVGGASLEETTSAVGAALVTGIKGTKNLNEAAGTLNATIGAGNMRMEDLVGALGTGVLPAFKNAGLSLNEFGAALATLTDNGMDASNAATRLRMTIGLIEAPSGTAQKALAELGLTSNDLGIKMQKEGLVPALKLLQQRLLDTYGTTAEGKQKMAAALSEMFGGGRSSAAIQTLLDQIPRVQQKLEQISSKSGQFAGAFAEQQKTASAKIKTAWSSIQVDAIQLGGRVLPGLARAFESLVHVIDNVSQWFNGLTRAQQGFILKLGLLAAAVGPALIMIGKMSLGLSALSRVIGISGGGGIIGLVGKLATRFGASTAAVEGLAAAAGPVGLALGALGIVTAGVAFYMLGQKSNAEKLSIALKNLKTDTNNLKSAQDTLQQSQLNEEGAALAVRQAQINYNDAVRQFGPNSLPAQQALHDLKQAQYDLKQAQDSTRNSQNQLKQAQDAVANDRSLINHLRELQSNLDYVAGKALSAGQKIDTLNGRQVTVKTSTDKNTGVQHINFVETFGGRGFALGGYTGSGGTNEVAGVVHKGEYVLPKNMVDQNTGTPKMGGPTNVYISPQIGVYIGTPTERRKLALSILQDLRDLANQKNTTVSLLLGQNKPVAMQ